jgi:hypothetical protein
MSLLLIAAQHLEIWPFPRIEQMGGDLGARWIWANRLGSRAPLQPGFTFVDVDVAACRRFDTDTACKTGRPVGADLVAAFIAAGRRSGASVIVLDTAPFESVAERQKVNAVLRDNSGPWIVAPINGRPLGPGAMFGDPSGDLAPNGVSGRLRLASFETLTDPGTGDGLVRRYAVLTRHFDADGTRMVPSAPYLASLLANPSVAGSADCVYFRQHCTVASERARIVHPVAGPLSSPIVYSLPSLAMLDSEAADFSESVRSFAWKDQLYYPSLGYDRLPASGLLGPAGRTFNLEGRFAGQIVVLGSSLPSAMDLHETPLGTMAGAEIIINAAHAFVLQANAGRLPGPDVRPDFWTELALKLRATFHGFLVMLPAWLAIYWFVARKPFHSTAAAWRGRAAAVLVFLLGMTVALYVDLSDASMKLSESVRLGRHVDLLTPVLLLGLVGYAEAMKAFLTAIEKGLWLVWTEAVIQAKRLKGLWPRKGA